MVVLGQDCEPKHQKDGFIIEAENTIVPISDDFGCMKLCCALAPQNSKTLLRITSENDAFVSSECKASSFVVSGGGNECHVFACKNDLEKCRRPIAADSKWTKTFWCVYGVSFCRNRVILFNRFIDIIESSTTTQPTISPLFADRDATTEEGKSEVKKRNDDYVYEEKAPNLLEAAEETPRRPRPDAVHCLVNISSCVLCFQFVTATGLAIAPGNKVDNTNKSNGVEVSKNKDEKPNVHDRNSTSDKVKSSTQSVVGKATTTKTTDEETGKDKVSSAGKGVAGISEVTKATSRRDGQKTTKSSHNDRRTTKAERETLTTPTTTTMTLTRNVATVSQTTSRAERVISTTEETPSITRPVTREISATKTTATTSRIRRVTTEAPETTATTKQSEATMTTKRSKATATTKQSEATTTTKRSKATTTTKRSEATTTTKRSKATTTTKRSEATMTTKQSEATMTTKQSKATTTTKQSKATMTTKEMTTTTKQPEMTTTTERPETTTRHHTTLVSDSTTTGEQESALLSSETTTFDLNNIPTETVRPSGSLFSTEVVKTAVLEGEDVLSTSVSSHDLHPATSAPFFYSPIIYERIVRALADNNYGASHQFPHIVYQWSRKK